MSFRVSAVMHFLPFSKIVGFYHVGLMGVWLDIVDAQLEHLRSSGLLQHSSALHITLAGNKSLFKRAYPILEKFNQHGALHAHFEEDLRKFELPTMQRLYDHCRKNPQDFVYYFHSKGASKSPGRAFFRTQEWRLVMEHFLFDRWHDCVSGLKRNQSKWACGIKYYDPCPHFSGNFFWAACHYVSQRIPPTQKRPKDLYRPPKCFMRTHHLLEGRYYAEGWLLDSRDPAHLPMRNHIINCFEDGVNHYRTSFNVSVLDGMDVAKVTARKSESVCQRKVFKAAYRGVPIQDQGS
eukprot:CAMPEP_0174922580 /NCGR_PEP_ID=MMETSP1355-20121228/5976_1 /TAXON_ID=464990 /ORGANISM="Hemiselmis tepida, Strain CCMP443" /LENGTH=292 /DNA_ID=CAMNT_0016168181 /DNA_START=86 /DNA_END=965 /DNA_ORIENTATION=+